MSQAKVLPEKPDEPAACDRSKCNFDNVHDYDVLVAMWDIAKIVQRLVAGQEVKEYPGTYGEIFTKLQMCPRHREMAEKLLREARARRAT